MDPNRLTEKCQEALHAAQSLAVRRGHQEIDVEHLLAALADQPEGLLPRLFNKMDVPVDGFRAELDREFDRRPQVAGPGASPAGPPGAEAVRAALDTLKTLAAGRQVVYLVSAPAQEYALVRRGLQEIAAPPGPAIWVTPGEEARRLALLRQAGPNVDAALVCSPALADAAAKLKIKVCRVPRAGESVAGAAEGAGGWADVPGQVSGWRGSDKQSGANP